MIKKIPLNFLRLFVLFILANGDSQHFWSHHFPNTFWLQNVPQANVPASTTLLELVTANMEFQIEKKWNGENCTDPPVKFHLKKINSGLGIEIEAPFFDDPSPDSDPGKQQAFLGLWDYEVVEIFFLASSKNDKEDEMYLELEFGPYGHHLGLLLHGRRNCLIHSFPITYKAKIDKDNKTWRGEAFIPNEYFPPNVDKFNAYAIHGQPEDQRIYKSLFPSNGGKPDFHALEFFEPLNADLEIEQKTLSDFWKRAIGKKCIAYGSDE